MNNFFKYLHTWQILYSYMFNNTLSKNYVSMLLKLQQFAREGYC